MGQVVATTIALASLTTLILLVIAAPLGWWLAQGRSWWKEAVAALVSLPIVLPPTVLGFYVLIALGPQSPLMALLHPFGIKTLDFSFAGLVIGSVVYSLPFAVQPIRNAFESIGERPFEVAATLGASAWDRFWSVGLPLARKGFLTAAVLVFAHTVGEFGVVLMIGGAIPGKTEVVSVRVISYIEGDNTAAASVIASVMLVVALVVIVLLDLVQRRVARRG